MTGPPGTAALPRVFIDSTGAQVLRWVRPAKKARGARAGVAAEGQCGDGSWCHLVRQSAGPHPRRDAGDGGRAPDFAQAGTAAHVERLVGAWRRLDHVATARAEARHLHRTLSTWVDDDGMVVIRGRLTPEAGAVVQRALEAASDQLFREWEGAAKAGVMADEVTPGQRRADALGLLAEAALAADLDHGSAGDRCQVMLHVDVPTSVAAREGLSGALEVTMARWTSPRRRRGGWRATRRSYRCGWVAAGTSSTSAARPAPCRHRFGVLSAPASPAGYGIDCNRQSRRPACVGRSTVRRG
jgi:hypothetical protein